MIHKKNVKKLILISIGVLVLVLVYSLVDSYYNKRAMENKLLRLPEIPLNDLNGNNFNLNELEGIKLLLFMDTDCTYCKYQIEELKAVNKEFQDLRIVGISEQPIEKLKAYIDKEFFFNNPKNFIAHDFDSNMAFHYGIGTTPHLLIYDAQNQLVQQNKGYMKAAKLIALLKTAN